MTEIMNRPNAPKTYPGLDHDINGGMTTVGKMMRGCLVFYPNLKLVKAGEIIGSMRFNCSLTPFNSS